MVAKSCGFPILIPPHGPSGVEKLFDRDNDWHHLDIDQYTSFHRYGLLWGPDTMSIFVDGKRIASQPTRLICTSRCISS